MVSFSAAKDLKTVIDDTAKADVAYFKKLLK